MDEKNMMIEKKREDYVDKNELTIGTYFKNDKKLSVANGLYQFKLLSNGSLVLTTGDDYVI
ncbi:hypothetical protein PIROE2DRAFT_2247 [Piromyces sp. E2]|nr:hypothetical protein PIROE2DRAFT_2247 [Piromyces sp. E2]|eukprot:OUM69816.1 hypothetical protein PIROE2DRAFT_2247 [Piromyces sp. E2]